VPFRLHVGPAQAVHAEGVLDAGVVLGRREETDHVRAGKDQGLAVAPALGHGATLRLDLSADKDEQGGDIDIDVLADEGGEAPPGALELAAGTLTVALGPAVPGRRQVAEAEDQLALLERGVVERLAQGARGGQPLAAGEVPLDPVEGGADASLGWRPVIGLVSHGPG